MFSVPVSLIARTPSSLSRYHRARVLNDGIITHPKTYWPELRDVNSVRDVCNETNRRAGSSFKAPVADQALYRSQYATGKRDAFGNNNLIDLKDTNRTFRVARAHMYIYICARRDETIADFLFLARFQTKRFRR